MATKRRIVSRLLAVDPSLTCSGWALFRLHDGVLLGVGKIRSLPPLIPLSRRLADLQVKIAEVLSALKLGDRDVLVCEAPTTMRDPRAAIKVEQVRSIFEAMAREREIKVPGRINPRSVHKELMGFKGRQPRRELVKQTAVSLVQSLFSYDLERLGFVEGLKNLKRHQDIVDAILVGSLAVSRVLAASKGGLPMEGFFEGGAVRRFGSRRMRRAA